MTLDELVAWRLIPNTLSAQWGYYEHDQTKYIAEGDWQPTRDIAQAWECLEKTGWEDVRIQFTEWQNKWHVGIAKGL